MTKWVFFSLSIFVFYIEKTHKMWPANEMIVSRGCKTSVPHYGVRYLEQINEVQSTVGVATGAEEHISNHTHRRSWR